MKIYPSLYVVCLLAFCLLILTVGLFAQDTAKKSTRQVDALLKEKNSRTPTERKIDSQLLQAIRAKSGKKVPKGTQLETPPNIKADEKGLLMVDISALITDTLLGKIKALGGEIIFPSKEYNTVRAKVRMSSIMMIAGFEGVRFIQPASMPVLSGGAVHS